MLHLGPDHFDYKSRQTSGHPSILCGLDDIIERETAKMSKREYQGYAV